MKKILVLLMLAISLDGLAQKTLLQLQTEATTIRDEKTPGANTATRVGQTILDYANSLVPVIDYAVATGTNAYSATVNPVVVQYVHGQTFRIEFQNGNTASSTLNLNGLGPVLLTTDGTNALTSGIINPGQQFTVYYNGISFQINAGGGAGGGVISFNARIGAVAPQASDYSSFFLPIANPAFTGTMTTGTMGFSDTGNLLTMQSSTNSYNQVGIQNTSNGSSASTNFIVNNDQATSSTNFGEFGINSSGFTGSGSWNTASAVYLDASTTDLAIGTLANKTLHFFTNSATTDNLSITGAGVMTFNGSSTAIHKEIFSSLNITQTDGAGIWLQNPTSATSGNQQLSPLFTQEGNGFGTGVNTPQSVKFATDVLPVQAATNPTGTWRLRYSINGAAYADALSWNSTTNLLNLGNNGNANGINSVSGHLNLHANGTKYISVLGTGTTAGSVIIANGGAGAGSYLYVLEPAISGGHPAFRVDPGAHTAITAGTALTVFDFLGSSQTWSNGSSTLADQPYAYFRSPTVNAGTGNTFTDTETVRIDAPTNGSGTTTTLLALKLSGSLKLNTAGNRLIITEGSNGIVGQVALVSGTKAVTVNGTATTSRCFAQLATQGGTVTTTVQYGCACTLNTVTITALTNSGTTNSSDTSTINYFIVN